MAMEIPLVYYPNVRKVLEILDIIRSAKFSSFPYTWCKSSCRAIEYHPGPGVEGADSVFYEQ